MDATQRSESPKLGAASVLSLRFVVTDGGTDWPSVRILVDGADLIEKALPGWYGFHPAEILGARSPLLPGADSPRRVEIAYCSCGQSGCGASGPLIALSPDGSRVTWFDIFGLRDPADAGKPPRRRRDRRALHPDLHFDRERYEAEIRRASADDSWETPRRKVARLVLGHLEPLGLILPPDLRLNGVRPSGGQDDVIVNFTSSGSVGEPWRHESLVLSSGHDHPDLAAEDIAWQLRSTPPGRWVAEFGRPQPPAAPQPARPVRRWFRHYGRPGA